MLLSKDIKCGTHRIKVKFLKKLDYSQLSE